MQPHLLMARCTTNPTLGRGLALALAGAADLADTLAGHGGGPPVAQPTREQLAAALSR